MDTLLSLLRRWLALLLCLAAWHVPAPAAAQALLLEAATQSVPAWPALRMLADPSGTLTAEQALARRAAFSVPDGPQANLGPRAEPVWLLLPLRSSADAPSQWMLSVDYPSIDRVDVYQPSQPGAAVQVIGRSLPFALHPVPSAVHAARLTLAPGQAHELLLRVHTRSTMVLPITLSTPDAFHAAEARRQLLQGLMSGAMLCLLLYGLTQWVRVLAVRLEDLRTSAQRAHIERDALRSLALTDALTGLPNRRGLSELMARSLASSSPQRPTAVYLLDLDGFKAINDRLGHEAGDELLVGVARRLQSLLRGGDTVARLGGDEFVVVADGLSGDADAQALGRKLLESFRQPFTAAGEPCRVGLTIGYALAPLDGQDAQSLLKRADAAMYAGKHAGRHCLRRGQASAGLAMMDACGAAASVAGAVAGSVAA